MMKTKMPKMMAPPMAQVPVAPPTSTMPPPGLSGNMPPATAVATAPGASRHNVDNLLPPTAFHKR